MIKFFTSRPQAKQAAISRSCDLFVSWSGQYALELASAIRQYFIDTDSRLSLFVSAKDIALGEAWQREVKSQLDGATQGLLLFTQDAAYSDWVLHEAAILSEKPNPIKIFLVDAPLSLLPRPLRRFQAARMSTEALQNLIHSFVLTGQAIYSETYFKELNSKVIEIANRHRWKYVTYDEQRWARNMERPISMAQQDTSPFDIEQILSIARNRIVLVAQNHGFMTLTSTDGREKFWPILLNALERGVRVDILAMHDQVKPIRHASENVPSAYQLWSLYNNAPHFEHHARDSWETLYEWHKRYLSRDAERYPGELRIFGAYFLPVTISLIDPDMDHGFLVVSHRMGHEASQHRPHFVLRKKYEPRAFAHYWGAIRNGFDNASWKRMVSENDFK
jgi:hypothetical protein